MITNPSFGQTGWRGGEEVVYDSKSAPPCWLTLAEFKVAKELRSQAWKRTKGPELFRSKRRQSDEHFFGREINSCEDPAPEGERPDPIPAAARPDPEQKTEAVRRRRDEGPTLDGAPRKPKSDGEGGHAHFGAILTRVYVPG